MEEQRHAWAEDTPWAANNPADIHTHGERHALRVAGRTGAPLLISPSRRPRKSTPALAHRHCSSIGVLAGPTLRRLVLHLSEKITRYEKYQNTTLIEVLHVLEINLRLVLP